MKSNWFLTIGAMVLLSCGDNLVNRQVAGDSICQDTNPDGDTIIVLYPKSENDEEHVVGYYENGNKFRELHVQHVDSAVEIWDAIWYYPSGKIWKYKFYSHGYLIYYRDYNEGGEVVASKGRPFSSADSLNELTVQDTGALDRLLTTATIPNSVVTLLVSDYDLRTDTGQYQREHSFVVELIPPAASYPIVFHAREPRTQYVFWLIEDTVSGEEENGFFVDKYVFE